MRGSGGNGGGGGRGIAGGLVPKFRIFGVGGDSRVPTASSRTAAVTSDVRPSSLSLSRSTSSADMKADLSLPVLLSVKKVPGGIAADSQPPSLPVAAPQKKSRGGFFRLFHRSATHLFQHPTTELNPSKPYKGTISMSTRDLRHQQKKQLSGVGGYAKRGHQHRNQQYQEPHPHHHQYHHHPRQQQQQRVRQLHEPHQHYRSLPPVPVPPPPHLALPVLSVGSSSSLNSSVLHHNLEHDEVKSSEDDDEHPSSSSGVESDSKLLHGAREAAGSEASAGSSSVAAGGGGGGSGSGHLAARHPALQQAHSSSSANSVISSDYDSGAFSRTSTPEIKSGKRQHRHHHRRRTYQHQQLQLREQTAALKKSSKSATCLAATEPLAAPSLVMAACSAASRSRLGLDDEAAMEDAVDAAHILACLDAAGSTTALHRRRQLYQQQQQQFLSLQHGGHPSIVYGANGDVSITVGSSTRLTIASGENGSARRNRLPLMGTAGLSPNKKKPTNGLSPSRTKISTVYVSGAAKEPAAGKLARSESSVTISNAGTGPLPPAPAHNHRCLCTERVTVNGQHHCSCGGNGKRMGGKQRLESAAASDCETVINV